MTPWTGLIALGSGSTWPLGDRFPFSILWDFLIQSQKVDNPLNNLHKSKQLFVYSIPNNPDKRDWGNSK